MPVTVEVIGVAELTKQFQRLKSVPLDPALHASIILAAQAVANRVRVEAPLGPTGNLRRSVEWGGFKKRIAKPVAAFVRVNRRIAPHAHLVEVGARGGAMKSNPFFKRGVLAMRGKVPVIIAVGAGKAIDDAVR